MDGWIKLYKKFTSWGWYTDTNTKVVFLHCLLKANHKSGEWKGIHYNAGEFITSIPSLCNDLQLTAQNVRTAINHLISTGEITVSLTDKVTGKRIPKGRIITVNKWNKYQSANRQVNSETTNKPTGSQQTSNSQVTIDEDIKDSLEYQDTYKGDKSLPPFKKPTIKEVKAYCDERRNGIDAQVFMDYYDARGWKLSKGLPMTDWKAAIRSWENNNKSGENRFNNAPERTYDMDELERKLLATN